MTTTAAATTKTKKRKARITTFDVVVYFILIALMILMLYPLLFVVSASFSDPKMVAAGKMLLLPVEPNLDGYKYIFQYKEIWTGYLNTIFYTFFGTVLNLAATMPCAYALSRKDLRGRGIIMIFFMIPMYFSGGMIPMYLTVQQLHIYNTTWAMVLPVAVSAYNLIVCRSFFESGIPVELLEAAKIDGCSDFGFFFKIAIPLSKTIIAVMCLFYATAMWNQFFNALMFLQDDSKMPLQVVLRNLVLMNQSNQMGSSASEMVTKQKLAEQLKYCVVVVSAFPLLCVYPFLQKYFAKGVTIGAVKG